MLVTKTRGGCIIRNVAIVDPKGACRIERGETFA